MRARARTRNRKKEGKERMAARAERYRDRELRQGKHQSEKLGREVKREKW